MKTEMSVIVTLLDNIDRKDLYEDLKDYDVKVVDVGKRTLVFATVDIREATVADILEVCNKYGKCEIKARMV